MPDERIPLAHRIRDKLDGGLLPRALPDKMLTGLGHISGAGANASNPDPAHVSIRLTPECWRFVDEARSWPALIPLPGDVQAVLDRTPQMEVSGAIPAPRFVIHMTRPQAEAVQRWLHPLHDDLKFDDIRRLTCLLCISRVAVGIMLSER